MSRCEFAVARLAVWGLLPEARGICIGNDSLCLPARGSAMEAFAAISVRSVAALLRLKRSLEAQLWT